MRMKFAKSLANSRVREDDMTRPHQGWFIAIAALAFGLLAPAPHP